MKLCSCNKCGNIYEDMNPKVKAKDYPNDWGFNPLIIGKPIDDPEETTDVWICPLCLTDSHLTDEVNEDDTGKPIILKNTMNIVNIKFRGIDDFNRPVFKDVDSPNHYGSTCKLFSYGVKKEEVIKYFKDNPEELEYFGKKFNCEPNGGMPKDTTLNII